MEEKENKIFLQAHGPWKIDRGDGYPTHTLACAFQVGTQHVVYIPVESEALASPYHPGRWRLSYNQDRDGYVRFDQYDVDDFPNMDSVYVPRLHRVEPMLELDEE